MILPKIRDPRLITIRRGGTLTDHDHRLLAIWAADCADHVLHLFEEVCPEDDRPREAIRLCRTWTCGECSMTDARSAGGHANAAARNLTGAARFAAFAAGQAACVPHVAAHDLGAAAYAIRAVRCSVASDMAIAAGSMECQWQRERLPETVRALVLDDQIQRNEICWGVFDPSNP